MRHSISRRRATVLILIVGLLAMLFMLVSAYITLARFDRVRTRQITTRDERQRVLESVKDLLVDTLGKPQIIDPNLTLSESERLVTGENYPLIPGTTPWLAASEPVRRVNSNILNAQPDSYTWPNVTSLTGKSSGPRTIAQLMPDETGNGKTNVPPNASQIQQPQYRDAARSARTPMADATGAGINDASFTGSGLTTEMANAIRGIPVQANFEPNNLADPNIAVRWNQFDRTALYAAPVRIEGNGGKVLLGDPNALNAQFLAQLFDRIKHPQDAATIQGNSVVSNALSRLSSQVPTIEPLLRARGGLLAAQRGNSALPPALQTLQMQFENTFVPNYAERLGRSSFLGDWQRFNLASGIFPSGRTDWDIYRVSLTYDATEAYTNGGVGTLAPQQTSDRRTSLTTISRSDDLAWNLNTANDDPNSNPNAVKPGTLKFYLGRIAALNDPQAAFEPTGTNATNEGRFRDIAIDPNAAGTRLIAELVPYYEEMLARHEGWRSGTGTETEAVTRHEQAVMLAVNTVAFAAPRFKNPNPPSGSTGDVYMFDVVEYQDTDKVYFGYTPQPFITQAMAVYDPTEDPNTADPNLPPTRAGLALAVELYNPHESDYAGTDPLRSALDLSQFAISVGDLAPVQLSNAAVATNPAPTLPSPMRGRSFAVVVFRGDGPGANTFFTQLGATVNATILVPGGLSDPNELPIRLWRRNPDNPNANMAQYVVDELRLDLSAHKALNDPNLGWWVNVTRDTTPDPFIAAWTTLDNVPNPSGGGTGSMVQVPAQSRWRMVTAFDPNDSVYQDHMYAHDEADPNDPDEKPGWEWVGTLGSGLPSPAGDPNAFAPNVPLHTMNAQSGLVTLNGATRPNSFPTVGFMAFIPRYAHTFDGTEYKSLGMWLRDEWDKKHKSADGNYEELAFVPIDFGHMPFFTNVQETDGALGDSKLGPVPWGQLVFDFFTTIDPSTVDPYAINGRIDVNQAPWNILAELPVLGPTSVAGDYAAANANLPLAGIDADVAFYKYTSGVMAGWSPTAVDGVVNLQLPRFPLRASQSWIGNGRWHLGNWRAQAAAAYRDRVAYTLDTLPSGASATGSVVVPPGTLGLAYQRDKDTGSALLYRPRLLRRTDPNNYPYGDIRGSTNNIDSILRAATSPTAKRGFLTLGELANVPGFDGSTDYEMNTGFSDPNGNGSFTANVLTRANVSAIAGTTPQPDYMRAVSLIALLDTHFLTTRSNTFTIYASLFDRTNPEASVNTQLTVDRTNVLPRRIKVDTNGDGIPDVSQLVPGPSQPEIVSQRTTNYYNARYDD